MGMCKNKYTQKHRKDENSLPLIFSSDYVTRTQRGLIKSATGMLKRTMRERPMNLSTTIIMMILNLERAPAGNNIRFYIYIYIYLK